MDGEIHIDSEEGRGTTVTLRLAMKIDRNYYEKEASGEQQAGSIAGVRILVVEDNELNMEIAEFVLQNEGAVVTKAWNGQEAVSMFREYDPQLILMDINMPVMNGYEATREIRKYSTQVPIIAVTAFAYASDEQQVMENGFDAYMAKPINANQLRTQISAILKQHIIFM